MSPTVFRYKNYRFFFFSREEEKKHIHVICEDGEVKFWLEPKIELAKNYGLSEKQINEIKGIYSLTFILSCLLIYAYYNKKFL